MKQVKEEIADNRDVDTDPRWAASEGELGDWNEAVAMIKRVKMSQRK
jgi:hypothetical protein